MRIDKYIWCVRLSKTRTDASKLCEKGLVQLNGDIVKASKTVSNGSVVSIKHNPVWRSYKVIDVPKARIGAKLISEFYIETTDSADLELLNTIAKENRQNYLEGIKGRPTKKNRRDIDDFTN